MAVGLSETLPAPTPDQEATAPPASVPVQRIVLPVPASMLPLYRLSVAQYHKMVESGILTEADRVELLEGLLVTKMAINPPHRTH